MVDVDRQFKKKFKQAQLFQHDFVWADIASQR